eukprot:703292-Pelagomonas_calceolata.AAC.1
MRVAGSTRGQKQLGSRDRGTWQLGSRTWTRAQRTHSTAARTTGSRPQSAHFQFNGIQEQGIQRCLVSLPSSHWQMARCQQAQPIWTQIAKHEDQHV